jgi:cytochrome c oxidase assembly protein subunit 15
VVSSRLSSFQRLAIGTTAITYFLILVGGLVRASGAGLGCPDWPRCFGSWIPPASAADLPPQFDASQFNPMLMWTEYLNRLLGVVVGLLILATVVSAWRHHRRDPRILCSTIAALLLTGFQGWLGGRVVAHELAAWIVTTHLIVALVIVSLLLYATVSAFEDKPKGLSPHPFEPGRGDKPSAFARSASADRRSLGGGWSGLSNPPARGARLPETRAMVALIVVTLIQVALGTQVRGRIDSAIEASVPRAGALATVGILDGLHRNSALMVFAGAFVVAFFIWSKQRGQSALHFWSAAIVGLAFAQIALGLVMAYVALDPMAQVGHLTVASLLLGAETVLLLLLWNKRRGDKP